jgi:hypothetical protein
MMGRNATQSTVRLHQHDLMLSIFMSMSQRPSNVSPVLTVRSGTLGVSGAGALGLPSAGVASRDAKVTSLKAWSKG